MNNASSHALQVAPAQAGDESLILIHVDSPKPEDRFAHGMPVSGSGWVVSNREVREISVYLGDRFVGYAAYGEPRPEVAERFPHFLQADAPGFSFSFRLASDVPPDSTTWLFVQVATADGDVGKKGVPLTIGAAADVDLALAPAVMPGIRPVKITVENASIDGGGLLRVSGWAISLTPLRSVELFLGEEALGAPETGVARPDVATSYPDYPGAAASGFRLVQDIALIKDQHPVLRVQAMAVGGLRRQIIVPVAFPHERRNVTLDDASIHVCVDSFAVRSDGSVLAAGWAVAAAGINNVDLEFDGTPIGAATLGGDRPDVGNRFPRIQSARRSGFSFTRRLDGPLHGEHMLTLNVHDAAGSHRTLQMPLLVEEVAKPADIAGHLAPDPEIRFDIDAPAIGDDRARDPVRGALNIAGWAVAPDGIENVEIFLDDRSLGLAYYGMRRADIAAAFPHIEGALLSGFALSAPHRMLDEGERSLRITFTSKGGRRAERNFTVVVSKSEETVPSTLLRRRVGQAELDLVMECLGERRPLILAIVRSAGGDADARRLLHGTLVSLRGQAYRGWRALIAPGPGEDAMDLDSFLLAGGYDSDGRLTVVREKDDPLSELCATTAAGTELLIVSPRAGDILGADALMALASAMAAEPAPDFWYADERRVDPASGLVTAFFKPDWSPELLTATNYVGRAWFASHRLARAAGVAFRDFFDASDYDLALRLTEAAGRVGHIPKVLFDTGNVPADPDEVDRDALRDALYRREGEGEVAPGRAPASWRIRRRVRTTGKVSFIIPTRAARGLVRTCIESIRDLTTYPNYELVIIDNIPDSLPAERDWVRDNCDRIVRMEEAFNWSRWNNIGAGMAEGEFLLFLNDDIQVLDGKWLETMLEEAERPEIGVVGPQLLYPDGKVQHAGMFLSGARGRHVFRFSQGDDPGYFGLALTERNVIAVTGACMLSRRAAYDAVGGFDEAHSVVNNDVDYCLRMWRAGRRVVYTPFASLIHHELATRAAMTDVYNAAEFARQWSGVVLKGDLFFNPNLSTDAEKYAVETEPAEIVHAAHPLIRAAGVRNILALKLDHIGDFITAMPAFRRLKQRFPEARLSVLASKASRALAAMEPAIDEVIEFDFFHVRSGLGQRDIAQDEMEELRARLEARHFDLALDLRMHPDTRHVLQYSGARLLAGFDQAGRFPWLDVFLEWEGDISHAAKRTHVVDRLCQLVEAASIACDTDRSGVAFMSRNEAWTVLRALPAIARLPEGFLDKPLICVHPAVGNDTRQWPEEHFASLIDLLVGEHDMHVALIGAKEEIAVADKVLAHVRRTSAVVSLLGALSLRELPMLLRVAALYVGNNSGPKHLAAALGTPTVGVHSGVVDATEWGPFGPRALAIRRKTVCSPCYIAQASQCHRGLACLGGLRPGDVYQACRGMLTLGQPPATTARAVQPPVDRVDAT